MLPARNGSLVSTKTNEKNKKMKKKKSWPDPGFPIDWVTAVKEDERKRGGTDREGETDRDRERERESKETACLLALKGAAARMDSMSGI